MRYAIFRKAVLQEDEGRMHFIKTFYTKQEADKWLDDNAKDTDYFKRSDYSIYSEDEK